MTRDIYILPFDGLTLEEQIIRTTSGKLLKHVRGLEDSGFLQQNDASNLIGCIKKLAGIAIAEHQSRRFPHLSPD